MNKNWKTWHRIIKETPVEASLISLKNFKNTSLFHREKCVTKPSGNECGMFFHQILVTGKGQLLNR